MLAARLHALTGIYVILDADTTPDLEALLGAVLRGGVRLVQYRAKQGVDRRLLRRLVASTRTAGGVLIVNDDVEAAGDADGVHLGQEDLAMHDARDLRRFLGDRLIGLSCGTAAEAQRAAELDLDYVGAGAFAASRSKADAGAPIGTTGLRAVVEAARPRPVCAIGGITRAHLPEIAATGATMAAVISAVAHAAAPEVASRDLVTEWTRRTAA